MKKIIEKISNAKNKTSTILDFVIKNFIVLPFKIFIVLLFLVGIIVSCDVKSATPWEQIPFTVAPLLSESTKYCVSNTDECSSSLVSIANSPNACPAQLLGEYVYESAEIDTDRVDGWVICNFSHPSLPDFSFTESWYASVVTETALNCDNDNYLIAVDNDNDGVTDVCTRGQCPVSDSTNSEYDFVISRAGGTPTPDQIQAYSMKCMPVGAGGTNCVVEATRFTDSSGYNNDYYTQQNSGNQERTGEVCGDLLPSDGDGDGTTASGIEEADFCFFSGGSMNCYRDPTEVCPDGNCIPGCASLGGEAWCVTSGFPTDGSGNPGDPPGGFGSGGAGTGDTSGGDGGNGDGAPGGDTGGGNGGGTGGDAGTDPDPNDNPECEPTANTVCGENDFYDPNDWDSKNFGTVMEGFQSRVLNSSVGSATSTFFEITSTGSCEVWTVATSAFIVTFDQHCSSVMSDVFPFIRAIIIALASFVSFRWAFL